MASIYKIINTITKKVYVGKTGGCIQQRMKSHFYDAFHYNSLTKLHSSMRKHGQDKFIIELIEECGVLELNDREIFWISEFDSFKTGYNMTLGGDGGYTHTSENFIRAMKQYHDSKPFEEYATYGFQGKSHSTDTKKVQASKRKQAWDDKTSKYHSIDNSGPKNPMFGKTPKNAIKVVVDGVEYKSIADASRVLGVSDYMISKMKS